MNFNGTYTRDFTDRKDLSFLLKGCSVDNVSGEASFSVNGEGQALEIKFKKGKIYDFDGTYLGTYEPSKNLEISGDISKDYYNFSIDGQSIAKGISKNDFKIENFSISTTDSTLTTDLYVYGDLIDYTITAPASIDAGETFDISMSNDSSDAKFHIYAATLTGSESNSYVINPAFAKEIDYGQSMDFKVTSLVSSKSGNHELDLEIDTNIGRITKTIYLLVNEVEELDVLTTLEEAYGLSNNIEFNAINSAKEKIFKYSSFVQGGQQSVENISLEYASGNAGSYYQVTGVEITNYGTGYEGDANIVFGAGTGNDSRATGTVVMEQGTNGMSGNFVSSVDIDYEGVYFNSSPIITFNGDFPDPNDSNNQHAEGNPLVQSYEKTFADLWDVCTGSYDDVGFFCFKENQLTGNQGEAQYDYATLGPGIYENPASYTVDSDQIVFIKVTSKSLYDFDPMETKLKVESKLADTETYRTIEEISITGENTTATPQTTTTTTATPPTTTTELPAY
jgi:hypothetical protein